MSARRFVGLSWLVAIPPPACEQRLTVAKNRRDAANLNLATATWRAGIQVDACANHLTLQCLIERVGRHCRQCFTADGYNCSCGVLSVKRALLTRDHDTFKLQHVLLHHDVN
jgi:hypothetical protein